MSKLSIVLGLFFFLIVATLIFVTETENSIERRMSETNNFSKCLEIEHWVVCTECLCMREYNDRHKINEYIDKYG